MFEKKSESTEQNLGHRNFPLHPKYSLQHRMNPVPRPRTNQTKTEDSQNNQVGPKLNSSRSSLKSVGNNSVKSNDSNIRDTQNSIPIKNNRSSVTSSVTNNHGVNKNIKPVVNKIINQQPTIQASTPISQPISRLENEITQQKIRNVLALDISQNQISSGSIQSVTKNVENKKLDSTSSLSKNFKKSDLAYPGNSSTGLTVGQLSLEDIEDVDNEVAFEISVDHSTLPTYKSMMKERSRENHNNNSINNPNFLSSPENILQTRSRTNSKVEFETIDKLETVHSYPSEVQAMRNEAEVLANKRKEIEMLIQQCEAQLAVSNTTMRV